MKKGLLVIAAAILVAANVSAQIFVGGSFNFDTRSGTNTAGGVSTDQTSYINFGIHPKAGYFLNDDMAIGASIGLDIDRSKTPGNVEIVSTSTTFEIAPFFRYYVMEMGPVSIFGEAEMSLAFGGGSTKTGSVSVDHDPSFTFGLGVAPAIAYKIAENIDIEASLGRLGFSNYSTKNDAANTKESTTRFNFDLWTNLNLGFVYKF